MDIYGLKTMSSNLSQIPKKNPKSSRYQANYGVFEQCMLTYTAHCNEETLNTVSFGKKCERTIMKFACFFKLRSVKNVAATFIAACLRGLRTGNHTERNIPGLSRELIN